MTGYLFALGNCVACRALISFNPQSVPSIRVNHAGQPDPNGHCEPLCRSCAEKLKTMLQAKGLPWHPIPKDAYEPTEEN